MDWAITNNAPPNSIPNNMAFILNNIVPINPENIF